MVSVARPRLKRPWPTATTRSRWVTRMVSVPLIARPCLSVIVQRIRPLWGRPHDALAPVVDWLRPPGAGLVAAHAGEATAARTGHTNTAASRREVRRDGLGAAVT